MKLVVCSVMDSKVGAFLPPFFARTKSEAMRLFEDACRAPDSMFLKHPADFRLWCIGEFEDSEGLLVGVTPFVLCGADEFALS